MGRRRVAGPGRVQLAAAMGPSSVVVSLVLGQDCAQVPLAEDQRPAGDLVPGGKYEPLGVGVRARTSGRDLHGFDTGGSEDRFEGFGELPGTVADQEPEVCGAV